MRKAVNIEYGNIKNGDIMTMETPKNGKTGTLRKNGYIENNIKNGSNTKEAGNLSLSVKKIPNLLVMRISHYWL